MKLTKITLAALVGIAAGVVSFSTGIGIGAAVFKSSSTGSGKLKVVLVTDSGVVNDKSFNQQAFEAIKFLNPDVKSDDINKLYTQPISHDPDVLATAYAIADTTLESGGVIIAPGFFHVNGIKSYQKKQPNSKTKFVVIDSVPDKVLKNTYGIIFDTRTPGFQAGYLAGLYLEKTGDTNPMVGLWGGGNFPGVTDFMVGFVWGIKYYNDHNGTKTDVTFAKFSEDKNYTNSGLGAGGGTVKASTLLTKGADILLGVAGPQTADAISEINKKSDEDKARIKVIGVDTDQSKKYSADKDKFLTSIEKNVYKAAIEGAKAAMGASNKLGVAITKDLDPTTKIYKVGIENMFTSYTKMYKTTDVVKTGTTWGSLYDTVDKVTDILNIVVPNFKAPDKHDNAGNLTYTEPHKDKENIKISESDWYDALKYLKDH